MILDYLYNRDLFMIDRWNIDIQCIEATEADRITNFITQNSMSGDDLFDIGILYTPENASAVVSQDLAADIATMPGVNLDNPWYNQQANSEYSIRGKQFFAVADYPFGGGSFSLMLFNKNMMSGLELDYPYEMVLNGEWTLEVMQEYCKKAYVDVNSNGSTDEGDVFGFSAHTYGPAYFYISMGGTVTTKDENGAVMPVLDGERVDRIYSKIYNFVNQPCNYINTANDKEEMGTKWFFAGQALFHYYLRSVSELRKIENFDYGLAIEPKFDVDQKNYCVPAAGGVFLISKHVSDPQITGDLLEAFSQASMRMVKPKYAEEYRRTLILRDAESQQVYDLCQASVVYDILKNCDPSGLLSSCNWFRTALNNGDVSISTMAGKYKTSVEQKFIDFYYPEG